MKHTHLLLVLLAFGAALCHAQSNQAPTAVPKGRLTTSDGKKIEFLNLNTGNDEHSFKNVALGKYQTLPTGSVLRIEQQTGTEAGMWALYLGGAGLVGSLLGVLSANNDLSNLGLKTDNSADVPIVLGLTAASALIGLAIGSGKKKYQTVYDNPAFDTKSAPQTSLRIKVTSPAPRNIGIGLSLNLNNTGR